MVWEPSVPTVAVAAAGLTTGWLATVGWRRRDRDGGVAFTAMMVGITGWALGDAVQFAAATAGSFELWTDLSYVPAQLAVPAGLVFVLQYVGLGRLVTRRTVAALSVVPAVSAALALTNRRHGLLWEYTGSFSTEPVAWMATTWGPWFPVSLWYGYLTMAASLGLLTWFVVRSRGPYRRQATLMLIGGVVPLGMNVVWLLGASPVPGVDFSALAFTVTGGAYALGLYSFDLLDLAPVARHTVVEEVRDGVVTVDREGRIVDVNPAARRLLGDGDFVGRPVTEAVPGDEAVVAGEDDQDVVIEVDGERRYFDVQVSPLTDPAGSVVGRVLLLRDVTERRRVEKRYQVLTENGSDLIHVVGPNGGIEYVSPPIERVLGYSPERVEGEDALAYVHPEDRADVAERLQQILDEPGRELQVEFRVEHADGSYRVLEARGRNLMDDPVVEGVVVNSRDVTERKRREQRLQRQNRQLEEFANVITHDLRNPLTVARGYADVLAQDDDDERLDRIRDAHARMDELLTDLLELAREGHVVDEPEAVDIVDAAREAWSTVETGDAVLSTVDDCTVLADSSRLRELFENLFQNAVEHGARLASGSAGDAVEHGSTSPRSQARKDAAGTSSGEPSVAGAPEDAVEHSSTSPRSQAREDGAPDAPLTVEVGALSEGRGFYVADDGEGIPEADRDRVFEAGVSTVEGGTGFGLSIVDTIADAHGWRVSITESTVGNPIPATGGSSGGADRGGDASDEDSETRGGARFEFRNVVCPE